jgi:hypothetical protein
MVKIDGIPFDKGHCDLAIRRRAVVVGGYRSGKGGAGFLFEKSDQGQ